MKFLHRASLVALAFSTPFAAVSARAQAHFGSNIAEMASTPLVRVIIAESLRTPPDEASLTVGSEARAPSATGAVAANKAKIERLLAAIRSAGIREQDIQTQGFGLQAEYR